MEIIILGSCVTRDAFNTDIVANLNTDITVRRFFARTSFISLHSPPLNVEVSEITNLPPFDCRYVLDDLNKEFYKYLKSRDCKGNYLVLDFIDERMDILKMGQHFLTLSDEFLKSNLSSRFQGTRLARLDTSTTLLWKSNCLLFIDSIKNIFPPERIILHKAFWMESYTDGLTVEGFPYSDLVTNHNNLLAEYYHFFETSLPGINIVDLRQHGYLADKNHKWSLVPFHYEVGYYIDFLTSLTNILKR
ncbi:MAG: DUF6270 domain-containing protein [Bacteroidetes bacterium]|nr:DUF6270 domain-containing protein [Bacteroidota bacterium]